MNNHLTFMLSHRCPVNCDFCCVYPPSVDRLSVGECAQWIRQAKKSGRFKYIEFTGGDPFCEYDSIVEVMRGASALEYAYGMTTSAYWAGSREETLAKMKTLKGLGLVRIGISCDPGHQANVPISNVRMLADISDELGLEVTVSGTFDDPSKNLETYLKENGFALGQNIKLKTRYILPYGKAEKKCVGGNMRKYGLMADLGNMYCQDSSYYAPSIYPNGDVYPCCSVANAASPLVMGNLRKDGFDEVMLRVFGNFFFRVIKREGFQGLVDICEKYGCSIRSYLPDMDEICDTCDLCITLMGNLEARELIERAMSAYGIDLLDDIFDALSPDSLKT